MARKVSWRQHPLPAAACTPKDLTFPFVMLELGRGFASGDDDDGDEEDDDADDDDDHDYGLL